MHHPQVVQSPIANYCLMVKLDGYTEPQPVPKLLLHVSVIELHNNLVSATQYDRQKKSRYKDDNIIISDSELYSILPPQFKTFCEDTRLYVVVNVTYLPKVCIIH